MNSLFAGTLDLLRCCSLSQVQMHKRGLCFIKVAQTNDTPQGVGPMLAASRLSALHLWVLFTSSAISLFQTYAFPLRRDKGKITVEILCVLLISLFRVNEKASFCTNGSLQEFYWISKTKMFLCTPCPDFTSAWEAKLTKNQKTSRHHDLYISFRLWCPLALLAGGIWILFNLSHSLMESWAIHWF